jgi:hypothetical protein
LHFKTAVDFHSIASGQPQLMLPKIILAAFVFSPSTVRHRRAKNCGDLSKR